MGNLKEFIQEQMKDEKFKMAYTIVEQKYDLIRELIEFRKNNNITQKEFAEMMGVKQQAISRYEKGAIDPQLSFVLKVFYLIGKKLRPRDAHYKMTEDKIITVDNSPINCIAEEREYEYELNEAG